MLRRREFISLFGCAVAAWPFAARAQPIERAKRLGVLMHSTERDDPATSSSLEALTSALAELGWTNQRNIQIDYRFSGGVSARLAALARDLVARQPDVLFCRGTPTTMALFQETRTIPIVFVEASDPIGSGFANSLARPSHNVTGFSNYESSVAGKWLELLKEVASGTARAGVIFNPETAVGGGQYFLRSIESAAQSMRIETVPIPVHNVTELDGAVGNFARGPNSGLIAIPDLFNSLNRHQIIASAELRRLPAIYSNRSYAKSGGLIAYGVDPSDLSRRAASYVDRILKGANPSDLPVQQPNKYDLVINLKAAKALGLEIPPTLLARADEVIE
jgi:putative ABC transport system substrate-binding protein